ncbi:S41 family peptidase [Massilia norwichensis]|uniref:S41 family peptidase n=1 Tax=Massilia norwichensis TaxID=1442366 RepID=A0ABT2A8L2_9BURK|nr:S41 family peptidase [Massilia norwichensis]
MHRHVILLSALFSIFPARAETGPVGERAAIIQSIVKELNTSYIDAEKARKLEPVLRRADFGKSDSEEAFAESVTAMMRDVTKDPHLRLLYSAEPAPGSTNAKPAPSLAQRQARMREENYGIERVERLPGNIGYLKTRFFAPAADSGPAIGAAMTLLANTDALIIDLRENGGGTTDAVPLLASYFFDKRTHIADLYTREGNVIEQQWTSPAVPGSRFSADKEVYILTSKETFSAAEGLAFALKGLKRAIIVGETTRGGAHPSLIKPINARLALMVPNSTARDPVTLKDWEGVGVAPDVAVPAAEALTRAQILILDKLRARKQEPRVQADIRKRLEELGPAS